MPNGDDMPQTQVGYDTEAGLQTPATETASTGLNIPAFRSDLSIAAPGTVPRDPATNPSVAGSALAPLTTSAVQAQRNFGIRPTLPTLAERNVVPGIELDVETGLDAWDRYQVAARQAEADQLRYLRNKYGPNKVRKSDTGEWIVRVADPATGKEKDILASPHKLTLGDFAALSADVPEIAASTLSILGARGLPLIGRAGGLIGFGRDIVAGAAGAQSAGAVKDVLARAGDVPIDAAEIAKRRAIAGSFDVALGTPLMAGQRFIEFLRAPGGSPRTLIQFKGREAQQYFRDEFGENVPLTVGQMTGNPDIIRREKFTGKVLGGTKVYQQFEQEQQSAMQKLQRILFGAEPPDDEVLGQQITNALRRKTGPLTEAETAAANQLQQKAADEMERIVAGRTVAANNLSATQIGDTIREGLVLRRDAAKVEAERLYGIFQGMTGDQPFIPGAKLAKEMEKIKKEVASSFTPKQELKFNPATGQSEFVPSSQLVQQPSQAFVPESTVMRRLNELIEGKNATYRFEDLKKRRTELADDLAKSEAVPGMGAHYLARIQKAITEAMDDALDLVPNPNARKALEEANKHYKEKVVPFEQKGIGDLFRNPSEANYVGPAELASRVRSGPGATDRFNALRNMLGSSSPEFRLLKRSIADDLFGEAMDDVSGRVDATKLIKILGDFNRSNNTKEIAQEVFGSKAGPLMEQARFLLKAQEGDKFPADKLRDLLASPSPTVGALKDLLTAERAVDKAFNSKLIRAIAKGDLTGLELAPEEVVARFMAKPERNAGELTKLMGMLSDRPALVEDIRTRYLESLFLQGNDTGKTVTQVLAKARQDKKAMSVLGPKMFQDLEQFGALEDIIAFPKAVAEQAGGMAAGQRSDRLFRHPIQTIGTAAREWVTAKLLTNELTRRWIMRLPPGPSTTLLVLSSAPFVESVARNFGPGPEGQNLMRSLQAGVGDYMGKLQGESEAEKRKAAEPAKPIPGASVPLKLKDGQIQWPKFREEPQPTP